MDLSNINFTAVVVAAVVAYVVGFMWHGPVFGTHWMKLMEIPQSEVDAMKAKGMAAMAPQMVAAFFQQLVIALGMAHLSAALDLTGPAAAIFFAVLVWFTFIATTFLNGVLWERRKMELYLFNIGYHLVSVIIISLIVTLWR